MQVRDILKEKGPEVVTVHDEKPLYDAIEILTKNGIGSVLALNQTGRIVGILTERDVLREAGRRPDTLRSTTVAEVMTTDVIIGEPDDELDAIESLMTANRMRHLPILEGKRLVGIISIGDVVKHQRRVAKFENRHLKDYIEGKYPA